MNSTINSYQCMSKSKKIWLNIFLLWLFISGTTLFFVDMFMSTVKPAYSNDYPDYKWGDTLDNQTLWLSVWCAVTLTIFSLLNFLAIHFKRMGKWISSKENWTFVLAISIFMMLVWTPDAVPKMINGVFWTIPYKPTRGLIEHWLNPILLLATYFIYAKDFTSSKDYTGGKSWYIEIFLISYILWNLCREILMKYHPALFDKVMFEEPFPYHDFVNPITLENPYEKVKDPITGDLKNAIVHAKPVWQWLSIMIAYLVMPWAFQVFFNAMSNINNKRLSKRTYLWRDNTRVY